MMKRKMISAVLAAVMTVGMITGFYIGKEANQKSCDSSIESVFAAYAGEEAAE